MGIFRPSLGRTIWAAGLVFALSVALLPIEAHAQTVFVAADAGPKGAAIGGNKVYRTVAEEVIAKLKTAGYKVIEPGDLPKQYQPRRRRPTVKDWQHVFQRDRPKMDAMVAITVVNRVVRSTGANFSSIDLLAKIYRKKKRKPVVIIDIPPTKEAPMKGGCFGPCMMRILSENVVKPARILGTQVVRGLSGKKIKKQYRR